MDTDTLFSAGHPVPKQPIVFFLTTDARDPGGYYQIRAYEYLVFATQKNIERLREQVSKKP